MRDGKKWDWFKTKNDSGNCPFSHRLRQAQLTGDEVGMFTDNVLQLDDEQPRSDHKRSYVGPGACFLWIFGWCFWMVRGTQKKVSKGSKGYVLNRSGALMLIIWIFSISLTSFNFFWGALISTYARAGDGQGALKVLRNCEEEFHSWEGLRQGWKLGQLPNFEGCTLRIDSWQTEDVFALHSMRWIYAPFSMFRDWFVFPSQFWFVAARGEDRSQHGVLRHCIEGFAPGRCKAVPWMRETLMRC